MDDFLYTFPAIRGVQARREYYVTQCQLRLIPRLFQFDDPDLPAEVRAQRSLNRSRLPEISGRAGDCDAIWESAAPRARRAEKTGEDEC